jgi:hypothetical protein
VSAETGLPRRQLYAPGDAAVAATGGDPEAATDGVPDADGDHGRTSTP